LFLQEQLKDIIITSFNIIYISHVKKFTSKITEEGETSEKQTPVSFFLRCEVIGKKGKTLYYSLLECVSRACQMTGTHGRSLVRVVMQLINPNPSAAGNTQTEHKSQALSHTQRPSRLPPAPPFLPRLQ
jgi:hypothetical protein